MPLVRLQRLELIDIWLSLAALDELIHHAEYLESLHLEDIWLVDELTSHGLGKGINVSISEILARLDRPLEITITYCDSTRRFVR